MPTKDIYIYGGVSTKIEVASRFEKSNQLYQKEAFTPLLLEGSALLENFEISMPWNAVSSVLGTKLSTKDDVSSINLVR